MPTSAPDVTPQELSQRFAQLVMMQAQNILYLLGRLAGPNGETVPPQFQEAKMLIDQLEMIQAKTKNNLTPQETKLLENSLTQMRLAFVEATGGTSPAMMPSTPRFGGNDLYEEPAPEEPAPAPAKPEPVKASTPTPTSTPAQEPLADDKKKFFKSYG